jgi:hypothetical protein
MDARLCVPRAKNPERLIFRSAAGTAVSFLLQNAELQTKDRNYRRYSRGRATTFAVLAMCWY